MNDSATEIISLIDSRLAFVDFVVQKIRNLVHKIEDLTNIFLHLIDTLQPIQQYIGMGKAIVITICKLSIDLSFNIFYLLEMFI